MRSIIVNICSLFPDSVYSLQLIFEILCGQRKSPNLVVLATNKLLILVVALIFSLISSLHPSLEVQGIA